MSLKSLRRNEYIEVAMRKKQDIQRQLEYRCRNIIHTSLRALACTFFGKDSTSAFPPLVPPFPAFARNIAEELEHLTARSVCSRVRVNSSSASEGEAAEEGEEEEGGEEGTWTWQSWDEGVEVKVSSR